MSGSSAYSIFCIGDPLVDMQVRNGEKLLEKYELKANDGILAKEKHAGMYDLLQSSCFESQLDATHR